MCPPTSDRGRRSRRTRFRGVARNWLVTGAGGAAVPLKALQSAWLLAAVLGVAGCGQTAKLAVSHGTGPQPALPEPRRRSSLRSRRRGEGLVRRRRPTAAQGLTVAAFARASIIRAGSTCCPTATCSSPRRTRRRARRTTRASRAGSSSAIRRKPAAPCRARIASRCCATPTATASPRCASVLLSNLNSPFGMALVGNDALRRQHRRRRAVPVHERARRRSPRRRRRSSICPAGPLQSSLDQEPHRQPGRIEALRRRRLEQQRRRARHGEGGGPRGDLGDRSRSGAAPHLRVGLRNPVGMAWEPETGALWTAVNERDELGSDLVPDYMTSVRDGGFYGWPYSYFGTHVDTRVEAAAAGSRREGDRARLRARPAHRVAGAGVLGRGTALPPRFCQRHVRRPARLVEPQAAQRLQGDLRAVHGRQAVGPAGRRADRLRQRGRRRHGRPVGVAIDKRGALLVADDVGNIVWRVTADRTLPGQVSQAR